MAKNFLPDSPMGVVVSDPDWLILALILTRDKCDERVVFLKHTIHNNKFLSTF